MVAPSQSHAPKPAIERRRQPRFNMALDVAFGPACLPAATPVAGQAGAARELPTGGAAGRPAGGPIARPSEAQLGRTVTVNISLGGCCLYSDTLYPLGAQLYCAVSLPGRAQPLEVTGVVVWFQKVERDARGYKLGLEFKDLSTKDRATLQALLDHPPAANPSAAHKRLLLVDDDTELSLALKLRFESSGFDVIVAANGLEALRKAREERPDVMILDLMLPYLNGYEVCRLLKFDQKFKHIPIILCTARSRQEDKQMGEVVGADAYVTKPFDGKGLIAKAEELLAARPR